jgi:hypothetical protein
MHSDQQSVTEHSPSPVLTQSMNAFYRNLPELLKKHCGKWVAYHGDELMGIASSETALYQMCLRRGLKEDQFMVLYADGQALSDHEQMELPWPR